MFEEDVAEYVFSNVNFVFTYSCFFFFGENSYDNYNR